MKTKLPATIMGRHSSAADPTGAAVELGLSAIHLDEVPSTWTSATWGTPVDHGDGLFITEATHSAVTGSIAPGVYRQFVRLDADDNDVHEAGVLSVIPRWQTLSRPAPYIRYEDIRANNISTEPDAERITDAIAFSTYCLWAWTGRQFGLFHHSNLPACTDGPECPCRRERFLRLPTNVQEILDVWIDGVRLDPRTYALLDYNRLHPVPNSLRFPVEKDPLTDPEPIRIEYVAGVQPPPLLKTATARLARELLDDGDISDLPDGIRTVTRHGLQAEVVNPEDLLEDGRTGMYEIDLVIQTLNPRGAYAKPEFRTPDVAKHRGVIRA